MDIYTKSLKWDKAVIRHTEAHMRSSADKIARQLKLDGADRSPEYMGDYEANVRPSHEVERPQIVTPRKDSPFKREKRAFIVEHKRG